MRRTITKTFIPAVDRLDARRLMAAGVKATLADGVLTVKGTAAADVIDVEVQAGMVIVEGISRQFKATRIKRIDVLGGKGDDVITVQSPALRVRINGGAGNNTINGIPDVPQATAVATSTTSRLQVVPSQTPEVPVPASSSAPVSASTPTPTPTRSTPVPPATSTPVSAAPTPAETIAAIVDLTNQQRVQAGLAPLTVSSALMQAASIQAANMARLDIMSHSLPSTDQPNLTDRAAAVGYNYSMLGENIAYNYADAEAVVAGWMASPGHRANILNPGYTQIGVSVAFNAQGDPYYAQEFGTPA